MPENDSLRIFFAHLPPSNRAFFPPFPSFPLSSPSPWQLFHSLSPPNLPILVWFFFWFLPRVYIRSFPTKNPFSKTLFLLRKQTFPFFVNFSVWKLWVFCLWRSLCWLRVLERGVLVVCFEFFFFSVLGLRVFFLLMFLLCCLASWFGLWVVFLLWVWNFVCVISGMRLLQIRCEVWYSGFRFLGFRFLGFRFLGFRFLGFRF